MASFKVLRYIVEGKIHRFNPFPLDMLRYDSSWPERGVDVENIQTPTLGPRRIQLCGLSCTPERWASFGWTVVGGPAKI